MKPSSEFKNTIKTYLDKRANEDELFAACYAKDGKNIDDCCTYILNEVQKSGCNGFPDEEIYGIAAHYYDEEYIEVGKSASCQRVVVNHTIELTAKEKEQARKEAIEKYKEDCIAEIRKKPKRPTNPASNENNENQAIVQQGSLF